MFRRLDVLPFGIAVLIVVTALPYLASLRNGFVEWDDQLLITQNPVVQELSAASLKQAFTTYDPELYIPFTLVSYQLNHLISGLDPFVYHLTNLLLHIANVLLIALVAVQLGLRRRTAFIIALIFALHPLNTEAVVWAAARKDLLSSFFALGAIAAYLRSHAHASKIWLGVSVLLFLSALLSKVSVALLPFLLLLIDWYRGHSIDRTVLAEKIPYVLLSVVFIIIAMAGKITGSLFVWEKFLVGCKAIVFYLLKFFVPTGLSVLYPYTKPVSITTPDLFLSLVLVLTITALCVLAYRKQNDRTALFAWGWFLLLLLPTFNNAAKGHNELLDLYFASDRYAYLPMFGLLFLIGLRIDRWMERFAGAIIVIVAAIAVSFGALAYNQSRVWRNTYTLFSHVTRVRPDAYIAHTNVGTELYKQGKIDEALGEYALALKIRSDATTWYNAGQILLQQGKKDNAMAAFRQAIDASPLEIDAHLQLARLHLERGEREEAIRILEAAKETAPDRADVQELLLYIQSGTGM